MIFFILITCQLHGVLILQGEIKCWSLLGMNLRPLPKLVYYQVLTTIWQLVVAIGIKTQASTLIYPPAKVTGHFRVPFASASKRVLVENLSYGNEFYSKAHFHSNQTHFHLDGFAPRLVLKQRQKATWKWPIWFSFRLDNQCDAMQQKSCSSTSKLHHNVNINWFQFSLLLI